MNTRQQNFITINLFTAAILTVVWLVCLAIGAINGAISGTEANTPATKQDIHQTIKRTQNA